MATDRMNGNGHDRTVETTIGLLEWFRVGKRDHAEAVLDDLQALGVTELRTGLSWAEWHTEEGKEWYRWLIPRLAEEVNVLPCLAYTPPELGIEPKCSSPPRDPQDYVDFVDHVITEFGDHFEWVELWNEPNNTNDWDWHLDPDWTIFCEMIRKASYQAKERGKKTVLAGMCPPDTNWLDLVCQRGTLEYVDVVGVHAFPGTWTYNWTSWPDAISSVQDVLDSRGVDAGIWITEVGYSTWQHDEYRQVQEFATTIEAPVDRLYWYAAHDLHPDLSHQEGFHEDERHYHLGLRKANGQPKLLFRVWAADGLDGVKTLANFEAAYNAAGGTHPSNGDSAVRSASGAPSINGLKRRRPVLITGGAGFVGSNVAHRLLSQDRPVLIFDNLSRPGSEHNLRWLAETHSRGLDWRLEDVRNPYALQEAVQEADQIYHFAGQTAVTTSVAHPADDFAVNAQGTMHLLEALRGMDHPPSLVFTSTNKVYGSLSDVALNEEETRYVPADPHLRENGLSEQRSLDFHSPYGCSKGAADQYILDYARTYGLPAVVFRMSCIYGHHQYGTEDQGWVAHFVKRILQNEPITFYGNGKQVRDVLFVDDLADAMLRAQEQADELAGEAFNIGGGPANTTSLVELVDRVAELHGRRPTVHHDAWREGDQRYYVSNTTKFEAAADWSPQTTIDEGVAMLYEWLRDILEVSDPSFTAA